MQRAARPRICAIVRRYAFADSPDQRGARPHRCDLEVIDPAKGAAAGYMAKYVAKNIDGHHVGEDLDGGPAIETAVRVEAWAACWGIQQFQQVGGPPVSVWRELRRVATLPAGAPAHLRQAHDAVNKVAVIEGRENASVAWDRYCKAQAGVFCGRDARIKLAILTPKTFGCYGDEPAPRPYGVETTALETYAVPWNPGTRANHTVYRLVESNWHEWEIVGPKTGSLSAERAQPSQPWTGVNKCTKAYDHKREQCVRKHWWSNGPFLPGADQVHDEAPYSIANTTSTQLAKFLTEKIRDQLHKQTTETHLCIQYSQTD